MDPHCHPAAAPFPSKFRLKVLVLGLLLVLFSVTCRELPPHTLDGTLKKQRQDWGRGEAASHEILGNTMGTLETVSHSETLSEAGDLDPVLEYH